MTARMAALALAVATGACGADTVPPVLESEDSPIAALASSEPLPAVLGIGRPATREEIIRIDSDVMPNGIGLPPGRGTAADGAGIFAAKCAACHGAEGGGTALGAPLVGRRPGDAFDFADTHEGEGWKTVGSYWPYPTTLFDYIRRAMPFDRPGSLSDDEVYSLTAWILFMNDIAAEDAVMNASSLPEVRMPARDRFVPDNRESSDTVQ